MRSLFGRSSPKHASTSEAASLAAAAEPAGATTAATAAACDQDTAAKPQEAAARADAPNPTADSAAVSGPACGAADGGGCTAAGGPARAAEGDGDGAAGGVGVAAPAAPAVPNGAESVLLWDARAHSVWWVSAKDRDPLPMARRRNAGGNDSDLWELKATLRQGDRYAFIVEWTQICSITGPCTFFGVPHDEADLNALDHACLEVLDLPANVIDPRQPPLAMTHGGTQHLAQVVAAENDELEKRRLKQLQEKPLFERMENAEYLFEVEDMSKFASEATGVRIKLYIAKRVITQEVIIEARDGSWGPIPLQRAEWAPQDMEKDAILKSRSVPTGNRPAIWVGDAPDLSTNGADLVVRIRRRDWRVDPRSLALVRGDANAESARAGESCKDVPPGPALWSVHADVPPTAPAFARVPDRELVLYEMHVGSFTPEGTFKAATAKLAHIRELGCTAISLMPVHQDARRLKTGAPDFWGYDVISAFAVDSAYGTAAELAAFVSQAHKEGLAVLIDYVANHMMWGAESYIGPQYFKEDMPTAWGPRPDFSVVEVRRYFLTAAEFLLTSLGFDGLRVDSTKSIRKFPNDAADGAGTHFLGELSALCRKHAKLIVAEDLEDGDGVLQLGGLGFHMQWDMAFFCWAFDALVNPLDSHRDMGSVIRGLQGLSPSRSHLLRGRVLFMESHDTAASDRYGRFAAAVHNGKAFMPPDESPGEDAGGDAFQKASGEALPYPAAKDVEANTFAARRSAIALVLMMTAPGVPMLLQGQETYEVRPFKWPRGPALDWKRAAATDGNAGTWRKLCHNLIKLRLGEGRPAAAAGAAPAPSPLTGDGLHVCHTHDGVLAYLRWAEVTDSRTASPGGHEVVLVVANCTNNNFPAYELGVPPSEQWRMALCTVSGRALGSGSGSDVTLKTRSSWACHGFSCTLNVALPPYSAAVFIREA